jgi:hypothetical protein
VSIDDIRQMLKASQVGYAKFKETGNVGGRKRTGTTSETDETVDAERDAFKRSPRKSARRASHNSETSEHSDNNNFAQTAPFVRIKAQLVQVLVPDDRPDALLCYGDVAKKIFFYSNTYISNQI